MWVMRESYYNIPKAIFYLLKGTIALESIVVIRKAMLMVAVIVVVMETVFRLYTSRGRIRNKGKYSLK